VLRLETIAGVVARVPGRRFLSGLRGTWSASRPLWLIRRPDARNAMVHEGLLKADSPRGIWEVTDKGRALLK